MRVLAIAAAVLLVATGCAAVRTLANPAVAVDAVEAPVPPDAPSRHAVELNDVACASPGNCAASGTIYGPPASNIVLGLLLTEEDGVWTVTEPPLPRSLGPGIKKGVEPAAVSCPAVDRCIAVGSASSGEQSVPLVFTQRTDGWRETALPLPAGATGAGLALVSCPSPGNCTAAGGYTTSAGRRHSLLVTETNGTWAPPTPARVPPNAGTGVDGQPPELDAIACPSPGDCTAVGLYGDVYGSPEGLLLTESGGTWARGVEAQLPGNAAPPAGSYLYPVIGLAAVSCASTGECAATGGYGDSRSDQFGMFLTEHAGRWREAAEVPLPANAGLSPQQGDGPASPMRAIACPAAGACSAIGIYDDKGGNEHGLLLAESGGSWTPNELLLPSDAGPGGGGVAALACHAAGSCVAVGSYAAGPNGVRLLIATEQNGRWARGVGASLPADADKSQGGDVPSVACPSAGNCVAVGNYRDPGGDMQGLIVTIRR
jgi:hypothetical protein